MRELTSRPPAPPGSPEPGAPGVAPPALLVPSTRHFFQLAAPGAGVLATAVLAAAVSIGALVAAGFGLSARTRSAELTG